MVFFIVPTELEMDMLDLKPLFKFQETQNPTCLMLEKRKMANNVIEQAKLSISGEKMEENLKEDSSKFSSFTSLNHLYKDIQRESAQHSDFKTYGNYNQFSRNNHKITAFLSAQEMVTDQTTRPLEKNVFPGFPGLPLRNFKFHDNQLSRKPEHRWGKRSLSEFVGKTGVDASHEAESHTRHSNLNSTISNEIEKLNQKFVLSSRPCHSLAGFVCAKRFPGNVNYINNMF